MMDQQEYLRHQGECCPVCGNSEIQGGALEQAFPHVVFQDMRCEACEATWTEQYDLSGYDPEGIEYGWIKPGDRIVLTDNHHPGEYATVVHVIDDTMMHIRLDAGDEKEAFRDEFRMA